MTDSFIDSFGNGISKVNSTEPGVWKSITITKTFSHTAGGGDVGTVALFTVTGLIKCKLYARCTTNMAGASATIAVGVTGSTAGLIAQTTATNLIAPELWHDATPDAPLELSSVSTEKILNGNIFLTVGTANLTAGVIEFTLVYLPISPTGAVVSA